MPVDTVTLEVRSRMMAGIHGGDTKPEFPTRSELRLRGYLFHLFCKVLSGERDLVLLKHRAAIFVHGCYWLGHDCHLSRWPKTRKVYCRDKITSDATNNRMQVSALLEAEWRVARIWECVLKGLGSLLIEAITDRCVVRLDSDRTELKNSCHETRTPA